MGKKASREINFTANAVALDDELSSITQRLAQENLDVTTFADAGPRRVVGNYDYGYDLDGFADFAAAQGDATIFALLGSAGVASAFDPTGLSAGANDPNYDSTSVVLESYDIKGGVGAPITYSAKLNGNAALTRAVA